MKVLQADTVRSPVGDIAVAAAGDELVFLDFAENHERRRTLLQRRFGAVRFTQQPNLLAMRDRLARYFQGDSAAFSDLRRSTGGTDFQHQVWQALGEIPWGGTISYHQLAQNIGNAAAVRAAASANARNPIAIIIPCHRVIGKNGALRGYAGGFERKAWLLRHEGAIV